jgi:hypothetical protein
MKLIGLVLLVALTAVLVVGDMLPDPRAVWWCFNDERRATGNRGVAALHIPSAPVDPGCRRGCAQRLN